MEDRNLPSSYTVDRLTDLGQGSGLAGDLRYCITNAGNNDTITFADGVTGTINLTGALPVLGHSIDLEGPGAASLMVRRDTGGNYGIFNVAAGAVVEISGLTITNGSDVQGGGINNSGTLTVTGCTLSGNSASSYGGGGGIDNIGTLTVANSTLSGNSADYGGGGIENNGGTLTLTNSTVSANVAALGGGINNEGTVTVTDCTFSGNSGATYGGGIYNFEGIVTVTDSTLSGNHANASNGGGIENALYGALTVTNSTLSGNSAGTLGGGIENEHGAVTVTSCTVTANSAGSGGGINNTFGPVTLGNTIVAGNTGGNISGNGTTSWTYSLLGGQPLLAPLGDYGGPTQTMPLLAGSPALNAGDPNQLGTTDQRGVVRSGGVNIGAYQASASAFVLTAAAPATAGTPFDLTVTAVDPFGQTAVGYTGTVTFTSADPYGATVPADYHFTLVDGGMHTFGAGATLYTAGNWDVTASDTVTASITGAATVAVSPAAADHLLFLQQPTDTAAGQTIAPAVMVAVVDQFGNVLANDNTDTVTLAIGTNPSGGTLSGTLTVTVVNGIATFGDLSIDLVGQGYTLHASIGGGLPDLDSNPFNITT